MPKRTDIKSILIVGAGPIVIGQACEFDYSGTQACKALKEEGYRIVLVNSNPATIMTDPELADATYIEPITPEFLTKIIEKERPDALLPTMGGQTALNAALSLDRAGVLKKYGVEMIGARAEVIDKAEDRELFREAMNKIGLETPRSRLADAASLKRADRQKYKDEIARIEASHTDPQERARALSLFEAEWARAESERRRRYVEKGLIEALDALPDIGLPAIIRPSFTLGGTGGGIAYNREEFLEIVERGLDASPTCEVLIEELVLGWKEYEMEVVRDKDDNCIIVCSIENIDPMGVHTGNSITVAPALTLTDKEYQIMRNASIAVLREIGVETGGSNVQFAVNPADGRLVIIEMNPRVSRSSALASKATGFPIAKIAAKLAVGYTLDELANDITGGATPASFEPTIDYVVTKIPRFAFEKFPGAQPVLTTSMKSVGEAMAIGRTFPESLQKALRSMETGLTGLDDIAFQGLGEGDDKNVIRAALGTPSPDRLLKVAQALQARLRRGADLRGVQDRSLVHPADQGHRRYGGAGARARPAGQSRSVPHAEGDGLFRRAARPSRRASRRARCRPGAGRSTCTRSTSASTPAPPSSPRPPPICIRPTRRRSRDRRHARRGPRRPRRSSFSAADRTASVRASSSTIAAAMRPSRLSDAGYETIMVNCNPETVSTDYDTSDRLYFEPLTEEDVLEIVRTERQNGTVKGVIVQFGGQTPLKLAQALERAEVPILGTSPDAIDLAEDRDRFKALIERLRLRQPRSGIARSANEAKAIAAALGFPLVIRPSYVLGGRAMEIVHDETQLDRYIAEAVVVSGKSPVLLDSYLRDAIEVDVDAIADGKDVFICGVMEHIEEAGVHSGNSACSLPPHSLKPQIVADLERQTIELARALNVVGLMNVQFAIQNDDIYILEVNPRASRTVPFVAKVIGLPIAGIASRVMAGTPLAAFGLKRPKLDHIAVKEAVFPFARFPGVDPVLGPEMRSTGEVMGIDRDYAVAFAKSQLGGGSKLPLSGTVFVSVKDADKDKVVAPVRALAEMGFRIIATRGTKRHFDAHGIACEKINKVLEGRPHVVDAITNGEVDIVFNTTEGAKALADSFSIRRSALLYHVPYYTTVAGALAVTEAIKALRAGNLKVAPLQSYVGKEPQKLAETA